MTALEKAIELLIEVFCQYSRIEDENTLTKGELKTMMDKELPGIMENAKGKVKAGKLLKDLGENGDSKVDFQEYMTFVGALTCMGHGRFANKPEK